MYFTQRSQIRNLSLTMFTVRSSKAIVTQATLTILLCFTFAMSITRNRRICIRCCTTDYKANFFWKKRKMENPTHHIDCTIAIDVLYSFRNE